MDPFLLELHDLAMLLGRMVAELEGMTLEEFEGWRRWSQIRHDTTNRPL